MERTLFALQRLSAMLLVPFVFVHLGLIIYVSRKALSAHDILARTQGSAVVIGFYALFVVAVAVHVPIGLRNILIEWARVPRRTASVLALLFALALLAMGLRAVVAVGGLR
jgi:fumarate reductase subunit C